MASEDNDYQTAGGVKSDGVITSMDYSSKLRQFAYASSDGNAYVHEFSTRAKTMDMVCSLVGHTSVVTCVKWNFANEKWITSSEDGNIKVWATNGDCIMTLWNKEPVTTLCIDQINGCIVAGVDKTLRVYEIFEYKLIQSNVGHTDQIRAVLHLPEPRNQYVTCSWDRTLRIWNTVRMGSKMKANLQSLQESLASGSEKATSEGAKSEKGAENNEESKQEQVSKNETVVPNEIEAAA